MNKPRAAIVAVVLLMLGIAAYFLARSDQKTTIQPKASQTAMDSPALPAVTPAPTPFWSDPQSEAERLRAPNPPAPDAIQSSSAEMRVDKYSGQVIDAASKQPLASTLVTQYLFDKGHYELNAPGMQELEGYFTDTDGRFNFAPVEIGANKTLVWTAEREGFERRALLFPAGEGQGDRLRTTFLLSSAGTISGNVVDQQGQPIADALVGDFVLPDARRSTIDWSATSSYARTNAEGEFILTHLDANGKYKIPASAPGYVPAFTEATSTGAENVRIVLEKSESSLTGRVLQHDRTPAVGASVTLVRIDPPQTKPPMVRSTNAHGDFAYDDLTRGRYELQAQMDVPNSFGTGCVAGAEVILFPGQPRHLDVVLPGPVNIAGKIIDAETRQGIEGVVIQQMIEDVTERRNAHSITSDASGAFEFVAYVPATPQGYEVRQPIVIPEGYIAPASARVSNQPWIEQDHISFPAMRAGEREYAELILARGAAFTGEVIETDGKTPAAGLTVFIEAPGFFRSVQTSAEGKFTATVPRASVMLEVASENGIAKSIVNAAVENTARLLLQPYGSVQGVVKNKEGEPQPDLEVRVMRGGGRDSFGVAIPFEEFDYTGTDGIFTIERVAPGAAELQVMLSASSEYITPRPIPFSIQPAETLNNIEIVLEEGDYIEGYVLDAATGDAIQGATLITSIREVSAETNEKGAFRLHSIPTDATLDFVTVIKQGYSEQTRRNVSFYEGELIFRLQKGGTLTVTAQSSTGEPVSNYRLLLHMRQHGAPGHSEQLVQEKIVSDAGGKAVADEIARGEYRVEVVELLPDGREGRTGTEEFVFSETEAEKQVTVIVGNNPMLAGVVIDRQTGAPAPGARVFLLNPPAALSPNAFGPPHLRVLQITAAMDGTFSFGAVTSGRYTLRAETDSASSREITTSHPAETNNLRLELSPAPRLHGKIFDAAGEPMKSASMFFIPAGGPPTGDPLMVKDGSYEKRLQHAGRWTIAVSDQNSPEQAVREIEVAEGEEREFDIDFSQRVTITGTIMIDGVPADRNTAVLLRSPAEGQTILNITQPSTGEYRAEVFAGSYGAYLMRPPMMLPLNQSVTINSQEKTQRHDFNIRMGKLEIIAVTPAGESIGGELTVVAQSGDAVVFALPLSGSALRPISVTPGDYRGRIEAGGQIVGESEWISVTPGATATMFIHLN